MTKNTSQNPIQKLYKNWTGNQIRRLGQFLVKTWSAFSYKGGQKVSRNRADILRQRFGAGSVVSGQHQTINTQEQSGQKADKNRMDLLHQSFTETSPDLGAITLGVCRQCDGKMSVVFILFPQIAEYLRKSPIQFDIPSSYLYVVVLQKLCL